MLAEKREVKILLFLFCRNLGEEGGSVVEFPSKKDAWLYSIFFIILGACFAPIFAGENIFFCFLQFHWQ